MILVFNKGDFKVSSLKNSEVEDVLSQIKTALLYGGEDEIKLGNSSRLISRVIQTSTHPDYLHYTGPTTFCSGDSILKQRVKGLLENRESFISRTGDFNDPLTMLWQMV